MNISIKYHIPAKKLDFVNINLTKDNKLFIDPLRIRNDKTELAKKCYLKIESFVNIMIKLARNREYKKLLEFIDNFYERNETRLGYSIETVYGKSFGENGGTNLVKLLSRNTALESGFVEDIFDFLIMVPNIGEDKVSDIITTIIFLDLVEYTQEQCELWKVPTQTIRNELRKKYPCTKYVILDFVKKYDLLYREYKSKVLGN